MHSRPAHSLKHDSDEDAQKTKRQPEEPCRLDHLISPDLGRIRGAVASEETHRVLADRRILAESRAPEQVDHIPANRGMVVRRQIAKNDHNIVMGMVADVHTPKNRDHISLDVAIRMNTAEDADGIVNGTAGVDLNGIAEMDDVLGRAGTDRDHCQKKQGQEIRHCGQPTAGWRSGSRKQRESPRFRYGAEVGFVPPARRDEQVELRGNI